MAIKPVSNGIGPFVQKGLLAFSRGSFSVFRVLSARDNNLCRVQSSIASGDTAECHDVSHRVATQAVRSVHTAGDFSCREEACDHIALLVENLSLRVDSQTAHGMVNSGSDLNSVPRTLRQRTRHIGAAECIVFLSCLELSILIDCSFQVISIDVELLSQFVKSGALCNELLLDVGFDRL